MIVPKPSLNLLFTTARVVTAVYRIASTGLLLLYMAERMRDRRRFRQQPHLRHQRRFPHD